MPRFKERDRFTYKGLEHLVKAICDVGDRDLADYLRGQVMPVSDTRVKEMPDWFVAFVSRRLRQTEERHPGSPVALDQWYLPGVLRRQFQSLKTFDPDFTRAFIDGRVYEDFSHEAALRQVRVPLLVMHTDWRRYERYCLVGGHRRRCAPHRGAGAACGLREDTCQPRHPRVQATRVHAGDRGLRRRARSLLTACWAQVGA